MGSVLAAGREMTLGRKLARLDWPLVVLLCAIAAVGVGMLYSAGNGSWEPWAVPPDGALRCRAGAYAGDRPGRYRFWMRHAYTVYASS